MPHCVICKTDIPKGTKPIKGRFYCESDEAEAYKRPEPKQSETPAFVITPEQLVSAELVKKMFGESVEIRYG